MENTSNLTPSNYIGAFCQNRKGLWLDGMNSKLVDLPTLNENEEMRCRNINYTLDEKGDGKADIRIRYKGEDAIVTKYQKAMYSEEELRDEMMSEVPFRNFDLENYEIDTKDREEAIVDIKIATTTTNQMEMYGDFAAIVPLKLKTVRLEKKGERKLPLRIRITDNRIDTVNYHLPFLKDYKPELPKDVSIDSRFGRFCAHAEVDDNEIKVVSQFLLNAGDYTLADYADFYDFYSNVRKQRNKFCIILNK